MCGRPWTPPTRRASQRRGDARGFCSRLETSCRAPRQSSAYRGLRTRFLGRQPPTHTASKFFAFTSRTQPTGGSRSRRCKRSAPAWRARRRVPRESRANASTSLLGSSRRGMFRSPQRTRGRLRPDRGNEWDAAELGVPGLRELGYQDAFRVLNGYAKREPSWTWQRIGGHSGGWRLDHLLASEHFRPTAARYHHAWRDAGLSDHSALEVDLFPRQAAHPAGPATSP